MLLGIGMINNENKRKIILTNENIYVIMKIRENEVRNLFSEKIIKIRKVEE